MLTLYVWGPEWNLPSIDPGCLTVIVYFQLLVSEEWGIIECNNPNVSPTGDLPVLKDGVEWVAGVNNIIKHMKRKGFDADEDLTTKQNADSVAYMSFVENKIYNSLLYLWYTDNINFVQAIRPLYGKLLVFPINYFIPDQMREIAKARLTKHGVVSVGNRGFHLDKMHKIIRDSYQVLSKKIGDNEFFFGDNFSTLDIIVYGHLATQLYPDLPNPILADILNNEYPELIRFCERMQGQLSTKEVVKFPTNDLPSVFVGILKSPCTWLNSVFWRTRSIEKETEKSQAQKDFERKRIIFITGAILFMVTYVIWNRIIRIEFISEEKDGDRDKDKDKDKDKEHEAKETEYDDIDIDEDEEDDEEE